MDKMYYATKLEQEFDTSSHENYLCVNGTAKAEVNPPVQKRNGEISVKIWKALGIAGHLEHEMIRIPYKNSDFKVWRLLVWLFHVKVVSFCFDLET